MHCHEDRANDEGEAKPSLKMLGLVVVIGLLLQSCASPAENLLRRAGELGLVRQTFIANGFQLESFSKADSRARRVLHVYLEGDGLPWLTKEWISADPTPRYPLMLHLMALDGSPSLYLGRPCYNGHARDVGCSPLLWTYRRYSPEVVSALADALQGFLLKHAYAGLVFIGHSGGGALALLLAIRFPTTRAVVTLAGNTDTQVWTDLHGYTRLVGSLNPANFTGGDFKEIHWLGGKDAVIPPNVFMPVLKQRHASKINVIPDYDHVCCWKNGWSQILKQLP